MLRACGLLASTFPPHTFPCRAALRMLPPRALLSSSAPALKKIDFDNFGGSSTGTGAARLGSKYRAGFSFPAPRKLADVVKLPLLDREEPHRVASIWREHHAGRLDAVAEVWSPAEWAAIAERKRRCPRFLYPVHKPGGAYFTLYAEWQDSFCIFAFLDDYRRNPSAAEPYLSVALYDDLLVRKQTVLVRGDFSGHLRKADAAHLLTLMRHFYFTEPRAVETFNLDPRSFDWAKHLADCPRPPALASS